jgi:hypothetical protein
MTNWGKNRKGIVCMMHNAMYRQVFEEFSFSRFSGGSRIGERCLLQQRRTTLIKKELNGFLAGDPVSHYFLWCAAV